LSPIRNESQPKGDCVRPSIFGAPGDGVSRARDEVTALPVFEFPVVALRLNILWFTRLCLGKKLVAGIEAEVDVLLKKGESIH
jgi:hypothetical protein